MREVLFEMKERLAEAEPTDLFPVRMTSLFTRVKFEMESFHSGGD